MTQSTRASLRGGPAFYFFDATPQVQGYQLTSWYVNLEVDNQLSDWLSHRLTVERDVQPGYYGGSDYLEQLSVNYSVSWALTSRASLSANAVYEHGNQTLPVAYGPFIVLLNEVYDHYGAGPSLGFQITDRFAARLAYQVLAQGFLLAGPRLRPQHPELDPRLSPLNPRACMNTTIGFRLIGSAGLCAVAASLLTSCHSATPWRKYDQAALPPPTPGNGLRAANLPAETPSPSGSPPAPATNSIRAAKPPLTPALDPRTGKLRRQCAPGRRCRQHHVPILDQLQQPPEGHAGWDAQLRGHRPGESRRQNPVRACKTKSSGFTSACPRSRTTSSPSDSWRRPRASMFPGRSCGQARFHSNTR